jgi:haloalkane dehalogenase
MNLYKKILKLVSQLTPSPVKVDFKTGGGTVIQDVAPYPKEVFWDTTVPIHKTSEGLEFVRTPEACFENLDGYNFKPNYLEINGLQMRYVAEGNQNGEVILMLHGQPAWSYLYRKMIPLLAAKGYRCIAPDMIGMGKSDKPLHQHYHTYDQHCADTLAFIQKTGLTNITLFCQDWGAVIGSRLVGENPDLFARFVLANGDLPDFTKDNNPLYIPNPVVINPKIKSLKGTLAKYAFADFATSFQAWILYALTAPKIRPSEVIDFATSTKLSAGILRGYDAPYPSFIYCAAPRTLPSMTAGIRGQTLAAWEGLKKYDKPFLSLIGLDDKLLGRRSIQKKWVAAVPGSKGQNHEQFEKANHFIQEDIGEIMADRTHEFIQKNRKI